MKSFNVDRRLKDKDLINQAILNVCRGKKKKNGKPTRKYLKARQILRNTKPYVESVYLAICEFEKKSHAIHTGTYLEGQYPNAFTPSEYVRFGMVCDNGKFRNITYPVSFLDQFIHEVVVLAGEEVLTSRMYKYSCGSIKNKGPHYGAKHIRKYIKKCSRFNRGSIKYAVQLDIRKCFAHIPHDKLKDKIHKKFKGHLFNDLCDLIIDSYCEPFTESNPVGLPIGFVTSSLFCNFYMTEVDMFIIHKCKAKCYTRYIDDMSFFGRNKKELHRAVFNIMQLVNSLGMTIKDNWQVFRFDHMTGHGTFKKGKFVDQRKGRALDMLGFRFFRDKTIIRKHRSLKIKRKARKIYKSYRINVADAQSFMAMIGALKHCDSIYFTRKYITPYVDIKKLKEAISYESRKQSHADTYRYKLCA